MRSLIYSFTIAATALAGGCTDDPSVDACPARVGTRCVTAEAAACFAQQPTITQGLYGCVVEQPDVGNPLPPAHPIASWPINVYADLGRATLVGTATTSANGFYELAAPAGTVYLCGAPPQNCVSFTIPTTGPVAIDLVHSQIDDWSMR